jgi:hypothetical protein
MEQVLLQLGITGAQASYIIYLVGGALVTGSALSWHVIRKAVSDNYSADRIAEAANEQGAPILYEGKEYRDWNNW